jgi:hypothetical protein
MPSLRTMSLGFVHVSLLLEHLHIVGSVSFRRFHYAEARLLGIKLSR